LHPNSHVIPSSSLSPHVLSWFECIYIYIERYDTYGRLRGCRSVPVLDVVIMVTAWFFWDSFSLAACVVLNIAAAPPDALAQIESTVGTSRDSLHHEWLPDGAKSFERVLLCEKRPGRYKRPNARKDSCIYI
jgi:hypothetical protein